MRLFSLSHLAMLVWAPALGAGLAWWSQGRERRREWVRRALALGLGANELVWYGYRYSREGMRFPEGLPLQLCDVSVWLAALVAWRLGRRGFEVVYYAGMPSAALAMITPDLWAPWPSYPSLYYFAAHGLIVATVLNLVWSGAMRPGAGSVLRAWVAVNAYACLVGGFNAIFGTNYMYLCAKPASASLLDYFGPWPVYIAVGEAFALVLFWLLWLPYRGGGKAAKGSY